MTLLGSLLFFVISVSFFGYTSVVLVILSHTKLRTKTNMLYVAHSFSYILLQYATISAMLNGSKDVIRRTELGCVANNFVATYSCAFVHINMFLVIAGERWIAIFKPLRYVNYVSSGRLVLAVAIAYLTGFANGCLMLIWNSIDEHESNGKIPWEYIQDCRVRYYLLRGDYLLYYHTYTLLLSGIITGLYAHILILARTHMRRIHNLVVHLGPSGTTGGTTSTSDTVNNAALNCAPLPPKPRVQSCCLY